MKTGNSAHVVDFGNTRGVERLVLGRRGVLRIGDVRQPSDVLILDLTRDGCGIQGDVLVRPGMHVEVGIANVGRVPATVLWCGEYSFGCMFDRPLLPGAVTAASGPPNVLPFPSDAVGKISLRTDSKLKPGTRALAIIGTAVLCWCAIGTIAFGVL